MIKFTISVRIYMTQYLKGHSSDAFANHNGYQKMFAENRLTMGIFLPLQVYQNDMQAVHQQMEDILTIDRHNFAAVWVRDIPLFDPNFGDAGQLFDPFTYLSYIAAKTENVALATGSSVFSLRHPIDLAKMAFSLDQLSNGRLIMGIASGDRAIEFPAYGIEYDERSQRFAQAVEYFRELTEEGLLSIDSPLGAFRNAALLPKPLMGNIPLLVTGASGQSLSWIGEYADGWLTYPGATHLASAVKPLADKINAWRKLIPDGGFRPHVTNEWIDLVDDPNHPRTLLRGGFVLQTGRKGLIDLLSEWQEAGVNHAALGIQYSKRPNSEVIQELAEEVLPLFPSLT